MNDNTRSMAEHTRDASRWSPDQALEDAFEEIRSGRRQANKVLVLFLDDSDGRYDVGFTQAGLSMSQAIALMEVAKPLFLDEMGY